jgi:hypothetical protein
MAIAGARHEGTVTTTELAGHLAELTPRLQVAVLGETLARSRPEEQAVLVDDLAAALEHSGYDVAAALLRCAYPRVGARR